MMKTSLQCKWSNGILSHKMTHWTNTYMGDSERITIAFDIYSEEWFNYVSSEDAKSHWIKI